MKKILAILLMVTILLGMTACARKADTSTQDTTAPTTGTTESTDEVDATDLTDATDATEPSDFTDDPDATEPLEIPEEGYYLHEEYDSDGVLRKRQEYYGGNLANSRVYDAKGNLIEEIGYHAYGELFHYTYEYDAQGNEAAGSCYVEYGDSYRYTKAYDSSGNLTETVYYEDDEETHRFAYTYDNAGNRISETFSQSGVKKYTYEFDKNGKLTGQVTYQDGKAVQGDVSKLVKAQLVTDIRFPVIDNTPFVFTFEYDGCELIGQDSNLGDDDDGMEYEEIVTDDGNGGKIVETIGYFYTGEQVSVQKDHYDAKGNLTEHYYRYEDDLPDRVVYQYDEQGNCIETVGYEGDEETSRITYTYNAAGKLENEIFWENGSETCRNTYVYNSKGWLTDIVTYQDGQETGRDTYQYDAMGIEIHSPEYYTYIYDEDGMLSRIRIRFSEDYCTGDITFEYRTVYVTEEQAEQLRQRINDVLGWM